MSISMDEIRKSLRKDYINTEKQGLINFIEEETENGYDVYSNINHINELIDIIVNWYEFKYPSDKVKMSEKSISEKNNILFVVPPKHRLRKLENLSNHMGYTELMFRIPRHLHPIIECWYKDEAGSITDVGTVKIHAKNTLNIVTKKILIDKYDGYILNKEDSDLLKIDSSTIEKFVESMENNQEFDIEEPKKVVLTHQLDLEIRNKIFRLISLMLLFRADNFEVGYIRAKKFIEEFNKYIYNLNLPEKEINSWKYLSKWGDEEFQENINKIMLDLKTTGSDLIEECGLSFKTICLLKEKNIYKIDDPSIKNIFNNLTSDERISFRDKKTITMLITKYEAIKFVKDYYEYEEKQSKKITEKIKYKIYEKNFYKSLFNRGK